MVGDYDFEYFLKMVTVVVNNYSFKLKVKTVVGDYIFDHLKKKFKTIVTNYGFMTWRLTWSRCTRLDIVLYSSLLSRFFLNVLVLVKTPKNASSFFT